MFLSAIKRMYPDVKGILDEMCELAKKDIKEMGKDQLHLWTCAVTSAERGKHVVGIVKMADSVFAII